MRLAATRLGAISQGRGLGNLLWDLAGAVPSLDQRFAEDKSLVDAISGQQLITFSRTSDATVTDSTGTLITVPSGTPRFDHNPVTGESLGLLVEEQRVNLLLRSEEIGTSPWGTNVSGSVTYTANATVAPTGAVTADRVTATADFAGPNQFASVTSGLSYTFSFYIKAVSAGIKDRIRIEFFGRFAQFRISTLAFSGVNAEIATTSAQSVGDGWVRVALTALAPSTGSLATAVYANTDADFYLWGAQLEAGAFPTSYIPTSGTAVTRAADVASITGSAFTGFYRQAEGTVFAEASRSSSISSATTVLSINDGTLLNRAFNLRQDSPALVTNVNVVNSVVDSAAQAVLNGSSAANKIALAQSLNDAAISANGGPLTTDQSVAMPVVTRADIGSVTSSNFYNGHIRRLTYWPQRLPNATLQAITQ